MTAPVGTCCERSSRKPITRRARERRQLRDGDVLEMRPQTRDGEGSGGQAVVGTTAGGIPEAVIPYETGLLVEPAHSKDLAGAIVTLLKDPALRKSYGEAGRERVAEHFGVDRLVEGTLAVYKRLSSK